MDERTIYEWGKLFASPWANLVSGMEQRAAAMGLEQTVDRKGRALTWSAHGADRVRYIFVPEPGDIGAVREVFNDNANIRVAVCFVVVRQPDESETRGDIVFDIFRMTPESYLWHFNRVYTPPKR
jgi:hypothetical protein